MASTPVAPQWTDQRNKFFRNTVKLTDVLYQMELIDIYGIFYPKSKEYIFSSAHHDTFSKIELIIAHKTDLKWYKMIEIIPGLLSNYYGKNHEMKLLLYADGERVYIMDP